MIILNERERAEFERHKKLAEEQINKMYYGSNPRYQKTNTPSAPSFTQSASPKNNTTTKNEALHKTAQKGSSAKPKDDTSYARQGGNSILNLLNFKNLKLDNDRLIIIAICLLLSGEEVDELLMLALIYIML